MKEICSLDICTGCGLCVSQCPKQCISMYVGIVGHLYPVIDQSKCISCGLCQKSCPSIHVPQKRKPVTAYAAWAKDFEDYKTSTSGGAASVLSRYIISQGGVVYGCAMFPNVEVRHIRVDNLQDLYLLKGAKYVQSNITSVIPNIRTDVKEGLLTLFIGTPCQVAAVKRLFKNEPDNLFTVDLICHGVPSLESLRNHVRKIIGNTECDKVVFRKENTYGLFIKNDGVEVYNQSLRAPRYKELYINTFFDGYTFRESCYRCQYARSERISDITIGDFWGLGKRIPADNILEHKNGCSVVLPITIKGLKCIEGIKDQMNIYERTVEEAVEGNNQLRQPFPFDWRIRLFRKYVCVFGFGLYRVLNVDLIIKYYIKRLIKK